MRSAPSGSRKLEAQTNESPGEWGTGAFEQASVVRRGNLARDSKAALFH